MYACEGKHTEVVRFLLKRRAHVFYKEKVATSMLWLFPCSYLYQGMCIYICYEKELLERVQCALVR